MDHHATMPQYHTVIRPLQAQSSPNLAKQYRLCIQIAHFTMQGSPSRLLELPDALLRHIALLLPSPEVPCTARLICKRLLLVLEDHKTVRVSPGVTVPSHAVAWWLQARAASANSLVIKERRSVMMQAGRMGGLAVLQQALDDMSPLTSLQRSLAAAICQHVITSCHCMHLETSTGLACWFKQPQAATRSSSLGHSK